MPGIDTDPLSEAEMKALAGDMSGLSASYLDDMPNLPTEGGTPEAPASEGGEEVAKTDAGEAAKTEATPDAGTDGKSDTPAQDPAKKNVESVPLAVFMEEKNSKRELERRLTDLSTHYERANARLELLMQAKQPDQKEAQAAPVMPDPDQDFMGAARYAIDRVKQIDARDAETAEETRRREHNQRVQSEVVQAYGQAVQQRVQEDPTFTEAQNYLINSRYQELLADGYAPDAAQRQVHSEEFNIAYDSLRRRIHPADRILALAKARGWQGPAATAVADPAAEAAAKLDAVKAGQEASASLSTAGVSGAGKTGKIDMKALGDMSDEDFKEWMEKNGEKGFRKVVG